ncbi:MAG: hypothetical protein ISS66_19145 [Desulfobacteraceae bacterium]|nr:hypothetical protein [Desulfobacteraceae bacterium]MBU0698007.1 hypothetical protein [Pseudomonadota bacterium]
MRAKTENVLVFGKRNNKVEELEHIMAEYFYSICLVSDLTDMAQLAANDHFNVIIVTDSLGYKLNKDFFYELRVLFPQARVLCLVDHITQEMEMAMRSARLVFLGSYEHFCKQYQDIVQSAVKSNCLN